MSYTELVTVDLGIYNVEQDHYALSLNGEIISTGASPCVIAIVIFDGNSVMLEHCSDIDLCAEGNEDEAINLYESIADHIIECKGKSSIIR